MYQRERRAASSRLPGTGARGHQQADGRASPARFTADHRDFEQTLRTTAAAVGAVPASRSAGTPCASLSTAMVRAPRSVAMFSASAPAGLLHDRQRAVAIRADAWPSAPKVRAKSGGADHQRRNRPAAVGSTPPSGCRTEQRRLGVKGEPGRLFARGSGYFVTVAVAARSRLSRPYFRCSRRPCPCRRPPRNSGLPGSESHGDRRRLRINHQSRFRRR
jgi:hypothetical protein